MNFFASVARERFVVRDSSTKTVAMVLAISAANLGLLFSELISMMLVFFSELIVVDPLICLIVSLKVSSVSLLWF